MGIITKSDCSFCLNPESLIVAGCQQYLDRFTWRHDSNLNFIAKSLQPVINVHSSLYADVNGFLNPSIITGENYRPDLLFLIHSKCLYVLELPVGFESNLNNNAKEKKLNLIKEMNRNCRCVKFVIQRSLTTRQKSREFSASREWASLRRFLRRMLHVLRHDEGHWHWKKAATLYNQIMISILNEIFDFWIIQSQAANCKSVPIRSEIYNSTFKKTNEVSI